MRPFFRIGRILGIPVGVNPSWFLVLAVVVGTLGWKLFPSQLPGHSFVVYWALAFATAIAFFISLVLHELGHSIVARYFDIPVRSITLFLLGAVAQTTRESRRPLHELLMAAAGPAVSLLLGVLFAVGWIATGQADTPLSFVCFWLAATNIAVGLFNLIPAFPMDGGRMLRAFLWLVSGQYRRATRWAALTGRGFAYLMIAIGVLAAFEVAAFKETLSWFGGLQFILVGLFINFAARQGDAHAGMLDTITGHSVREVMLTGVPVVLADTSIRATLNGELAGYGPQREFAFVSDGERFLGLASRPALLDVPDRLWDEVTVGRVARPASSLAAVSPDENLGELIQRMDSEEIPIFLVVYEGEVIGVVHRGQIIALLNRLTDRKHAA